MHTYETNLQGFSETIGDICTVRGLPEEARKRAARRLEWKAAGNFAHYANQAQRPKALSLSKGFGKDCSVSPLSAGLRTGVLQICKGVLTRLRRNQRMQPPKRQDAKKHDPKVSSWRLGVLTVQNLVGKTRLFRSLAGSLAHYANRSQRPKALSLSKGFGKDCSVSPLSAGCGREFCKLCKWVLSAAEPQPKDATAKTPRRQETRSESFFLAPWRLGGSKSCRKNKTRPECSAVQYRVNGGSLGKDWSVLPPHTAGPRTGVLHITQMGLRGMAETLGKVCHVSPPFRGWPTRIRDVPGAGRFPLRTMCATRLGTPISRLATFDADCLCRPRATWHPASDVHSHAIRAGFGGFAMGMKRGHGSSVPRLLTTPIGKVFQLLFSAFHPRPLRVPHAWNPPKAPYFAQRPSGGWVTR